MMPLVGFLPVTDERFRGTMHAVEEHWPVGNFPQAFSHVPLIDTARHLSAPGTPKAERVS